MCGRFTQYRTREEYLKELTGHLDQDINYDPDLIARYHVAPGTRVWLLNQRDNELQLAPVYWAMHQAGSINSRS